MRKSLLSSVIVCLFFQVALSYAQLSNLTPQQIQQKAAEMGYNIDTTQIREAEQAQKAQAPAPSQASVVVTPPPPPPKSAYTVASFVDRPGAGDLPAFGYDVFTYSPTTFQPALNVPTPMNYVVGPGDELIISLWGETQLVQDLVVSKNGDVYIPNVGLINVGGLTLDQVKQKLYDRLSQVYASLKVTAKGGPQTHMNVSTGQLRSVKIYVLGEVNKPGGYTLPALSSAFTALYYSGGPTINGTLRNVEVLRGGKIIADIDLYNYLLTGDQSEDIRLNDEDIIFVPPVGKRVAVYGGVFRPAIYELKNGESLKDLLSFAGGLTFKAYFQTIHINRVIPFQQRDLYRNNILNIDLNFSSVDALEKSTYSLDDGDVVNIPFINEVPENKVSITGDVRQPGTYELTDSAMTVSDLIIKADSLFPDAFLDKALLIRTLPSEKKEAVSFNLRKALMGNPDDNVVLRNRDSVIVYKDSSFFPTRTVEISGEVRKPGVYTRLENMTLTDLIVNAGGLTDLATTRNIEVTRMDTVNSNVFATKFTVSLPEDYWNVPREKDFLLQDYDRVLVKADSSKQFMRTVTVSGEVVFPGTYTILYRGEKLSDFIRRAGGFKSTAYTEGMYVLRSNPALNIFKPVPIPDTTLLRIFQGQPLIDRSQFAREYSSRIPISWKDIEEDSTSIYNLELMPGDNVIVPKDPQTVTVAGDVGVPSTVPYRKGEGLSYYIKQAGGYTTTSAKGGEIVVLPNGKKWERSGWFFIKDPDILAGSVIYVPSEIKTPSADIWPFIRDIITVVSSTAVLILTIKRL
jgi:polysaccharide export outer membrane protein